MGFEMLNVSSDLVTDAAIQITQKDIFNEISLYFHSVLVRTIWIVGIIFIMVLVQQKVKEKCVDGYEYIADIYKAVLLGLIFMVGYILFSLAGGI